MPARLSHFGRELQSRIKDFFDLPLGPDSTPLEIREAVLEEIEHKVQPVGRGRRVLPYNRISVQVLQGTADGPALEACFADVTARLRERLDEVRCEIPQDLEVTVSVLSQAPEGWMARRMFAVACEAAPTASAGARERRATRTVRITVLKGEATEGVYVFTDREVSIGRTAQAEDHLGRVRRNRVAFRDISDGVTETVGRAHARLQMDPRTGEYRLFDDGSSNGTSIVREGNVIPVPSRDPRGVRVESGDEIQLGRAIVQVSFD